MCDGCGRIFKIEKEDIYRTTCYYYTGDTDTCYTTICPNCEREKDISISLLPLDIINECKYNNREEVLSRYRRKHRWFK